jgi:hypothetical protein
MRIAEIRSLHGARWSLTLLAISLATIQAVTASSSQACDADVRVLLIGSHSGGPTNWITVEAFKIENLLEFNGIPYDFFDVYEDELSQAILDSCVGIILEGYAMRWCATDAERRLIVNNMEAGNVTALLGLVHGEYTELDSTLYGAFDITVDGLGNSESNIQLLDGASKIYDYSGDDGFVVSGGGGSHIAICAKSFGTWSGVSDVYGADRTYGLEFALETWMEHAFGVDARVTMPVISLRLDDSQTTTGERHQSVIDFMAANQHRLRASGFLVTCVSAYQHGDSTLQSDEQLISHWGSMSLHGENHGTVGAEGENRDYSTQYNDMTLAVQFLQEHFPRYKPIKASPDNSWNEATLHAMYDNGIFYHTACYSKSEAYSALYQSVFDATTEMERQKIRARGDAGQLRYYPLKHSDGTGVATIYSIDWGPVVSGITPVSAVLPTLRRHALDWWVPVCVGAHYTMPGFGGANNNPIGWMLVMEELMEIVDEDSYSWRRWVDTYDFARYLERFDRSLTVSGISVSGATITYDLTAAEPIRFLALKTRKAGHKVASVTIGGQEYAYFGTDYVHLPEIYGHVVVCVTLTPYEDIGPHVTYIDPGAVIENAGYADGRLTLEVSGDSEVTIRIAGSSKAFRHGTTRVYSDTTLDLRLDASSVSQTEQVDMRLGPVAGTIDVSIEVWDSPDTCYKRWTEAADMVGIEVYHSIGDLEPDSSYVVHLDGSVIGTHVADTNGCIWFQTLSTDSAQILEVMGSASAGIRPCDFENAAPHRAMITGISPMPFRTLTTIHYETHGPRRLRLTIYSSEGRYVATLVDLIQPAGGHSIAWDGQSEYGTTLSAGVYFCCLEAGGHRHLEKIVLVR